MEKITIENIDKEIAVMLAEKPISCDNLEKFVLLSRARKYLCRMRKELTQEEAEKWVHSMNPAFKWTMLQTTAVMNQKGYLHRPCEFWAVMNSLYSDYCHTIQKHNVDTPDLWAELAHDWLSDADAVENKAHKYFVDIVKHD